jgi:hypothetical protein
VASKDGKIGLDKDIFPVTGTREIASTSDEIFSTLRASDTLEFRVLDSGTSKDESSITDTNAPKLFMSSKFEGKSKINLFDDDGIGIEIFV